MQFDESKEKVNETSQSAAVSPPRSFTDVDSEHNGAGLGSNESLPDLQRKLKSRHVQMVAIGGCIGTGLFIGSGGAISQAGPVGALIAYLFVGSLVLSVMVSLGEVATTIPTGSFTSYAARLVDPSLGFAMGWIYWFSWAITYALELTATGLIIQYWDKTINIGIFIAIFWVLITGINFMPVRPEPPFARHGIVLIRLLLGFLVRRTGILVFADQSHHHYRIHSVWHLYRCRCWPSGLSGLPQLGSSGSLRPVSHPLITVDSQVRGFLERPHPGVLFLPRSVKPCAFIKIIFRA